MGTAIQFGGARADLRLDPDARCSPCIVWYILNRTAFGRHVYAIGDDPDAARLAGINTNRMLLARLRHRRASICAVAGWVLIGRIGAVSPHCRRRPPTSTSSPPW